MVELGLSYHPAPVTQAAISLEVAKRRHREGQCVSCGVQTHTVKKRMGVPYKRIALTLPNIVSHGACLRESCLQGKNQGGSEHQVQQQQQQQPPIRPTRPPVHVSVGSSGVSATIGNPAQSIPSFTPSSIMGGYTSSPYSSGSSSLQQPLTQSQQQPAQANQNLSALLTQSRQKSAQANQNLSAILAQSRQRSAQANCDLKQILAQSRQRSAQANQNLADIMAQSQQRSEEAQRQLQASMAQRKYGF